MFEKPTSEYSHSLIQASVRALLFAEPRLFCRVEELSSNSSGNRKCCLPSIYSETPEANRRRTLQHFKSWQVASLELDQVSFSSSITPKSSSCRQRFSHLANDGHNPDEMLFSHLTAADDQLIHAENPPFLT